MQTKNGAGIKKFFRILSYGVAGILLLLLILYALLRSSYVQTKLVAYATYRIEQTTGVKIQIGGVDFRPVKSLVLNDVLIRDYRQDTLLYCRKLGVKVDSFRFVSQRFCVKDIIFQDAYFNLWIERGEEQSVMNLDVFLEALQKKAGGKDLSPVAGGGVSWTVDLQRIRVRNSRFVYKENEYETVDYGINWTDVECRRVDADITDLDLEGDRVGMRISGLCLEEKSGFSIEQLEGVMSACDSNLRITDARIHTSRSFLDLRELEYNWVPGRRDWRNFITRMQQYYRLEESQVSFIDLAYFNGILRGIDNTVGCKGVVRNTVHRLEGQQLEFTFGQGSRLTGRFKSQGLPDFRNTVFEMDIEEARLVPGDLETIYLPWFGYYIPVPGPLYHWQAFDVDGKFRGTIEDFVLSLKSRTPGFRGSLKFAYSPCATPDSADCSHISGDFNFPVVHFGRLAGTGVLGIGRMDGVYTGKLSDEHIRVNLTGKVPVMAVGAGKVRDMGLFLTLEDDRIHVISSLDNDSVKMSAALTYDTSDDVGFLSSKGEVEIDNLQSFGWAFAGGRERVRTGFDLVFAEKDRENHFGNFTFSDFTYEGENGNFSLENISLENRLDKGYHTASLLSDVVDMQIEGRYMSVRPLDFTYKLVQEYLPVYVHKDRKKLRRAGGKEKIGFHYDIDIKEADRILSVVYPELKIASGTKITADFREDRKEVHLRLESDSVRYKDFVLTNSCIHMQGDSARLYTVYTADKFGCAGLGRIYNVRNELTLADNGVYNRLAWSNWSDRTYSGELAADVRFIPTGKDDFRTEVAIHPGVIVVADKVWEVSKSAVSAEGKEISVRDFRIGSGGQFLTINGDVSVDPGKELTFRLQHFDLSELSRVMTDSQFTVFGIATGNVTVRDYYRDNLLYSDIRIGNWGINRDTLGSLRMLSVWDADSSRMKLQAENRVDGALPLLMEGYYHPSGDSLNVEVVLSKIGLDRIGIYASDYFTASRGGVSGRIKVAGPVMHPDFSGYLFLDSVALTLKDLNTSFFVNDSIYVNKSSFLLNNLVIRDAVGQASFCSGYYRFWEDRYDVNIASQNFLLMNTDYNQNESFYGKLFMSGLTNINNRNGTPALTVNARAENNSRLFLPLTSALTEENGNFLHFVNSVQKDRRKTVQAGTEGMQLNANLEINDNLEIQIVFDPTIGDILKTRGSGDIKITLDQDGMINMFGEYRISKGDYLFTLSNLLNKKFVLTSGGSLAWNGSPYDATIDIHAVYNLKTSLYELLTGTGSTVDKSTKVPVECILSLSDNFTNPLVKFDINFPTLDTQTKSYVQSLFSSQDEINKQMFSLLILNKFYTPDYITAAEVEERNAGYQAGVTTASELVSNQLSRWLSKISNNFDIGFSYRPGDNITTDEIEVALSTQLLNDRVTLSANGNMDVGNAKNNVTAGSANSNNIAGDFDLDVKLNKQGTLKLKAYSHTDEKIIYNATETIQGVGISYQEAFDTFRELLQKYFGFLRRKNKEKN